MTTDPHENSDTPSVVGSSGPAGGKRQCLSLLLALHCLCVGAALLGNYQPSLLLQRFLSVMSPYLVTFHLDPAPATFYSTHGNFDDAGHHFEVLGPNVVSGEAAGPQWTRLADFPHGAPERLRHLRLAKLAAALVEAEAEEELSALVRDVALWTRRQGREAIAIRLRRQQLQSREDVASFGAMEGRRNPLDPSYFETLYTADLLVNGEQLSLVKRSPDSETARVTP